MRRRPDPGDAAEPMSGRFRGHAPVPDRNAADSSRTESPQLRINAAIPRRARRVIADVPGQP